MTYIKMITSLEEKYFPSIIHFLLGNESLARTKARGTKLARNSIQAVLV